MAGYGYGDGYTYSDHVRRPVIMDANVRKQPIVRYTTPEESYVVRRETIVEQIHKPIPGYNNYGGTTVHNDKWHRPSSPIHDRGRPQKMVEHYRYNSGSPTNYEVNDNDKYFHRPSSPNHNRPRKIEQFIAKVQDEVSQPPLTGSYWRNPTGHTESTGYGNWNKPSRNEKLTDQPNMVNNGEYWSRPGPLGSTKPAGRPLTGPTNDINEAMSFLIEAAKPITTAGEWNSRYSEPVSKKDGYIETIDSSEAKRRYARPAVFNTRSSESYNGTINSKDAVNKYGGAFVP